MRYLVAAIAFATLAGFAANPGGAAGRGIVLNARGTGVVVYAPGALRVGQRIACADGARKVSAKVPERGGTLVTRDLNRRSTLTLRLHNGPDGAVLASCRVTATHAPKSGGWLPYAP